LAQTEAQTSQVDAQTASIYQDIEIQDDLRGILLDQETARLGILQSEEVQAGIRARHLDEEITASLAESYARVRGLDNENELFEATFDSMVSKMESEADITRSEAAYLVATESARIALAQGNVELLQTNIDKLNSEIANIDANTERTGIAMEADRLAITEAQVKIAQDLVENGDVELLNAVGRDLLAPVVGEDQADQLVSDLAEIATSNRDDDEKLVDANLRIALAEAAHQERTLDSRVRGQLAQTEYAEWQSANAERIQSFNEWATQEGLRLDERRVDLLFAQFDAQQAVLEWQRNNPDAGPVPSSLDVIGAIRGARNQSVDDIEGMWLEYQAAEENLLLLERGLDNIAPDVLQQIILDYDIPESVIGQNGEYDPDTLRQIISLRATQLRNQAVAGATSYLTLGAGQGVLLTPEELGFSTSLYESAAAALGVVNNGENGDAPPDVQTFLRVTAAGAPEAGAYSALEATTLWDNAESQGLLPALRANGINTPEALRRIVNGTVAERSTIEASFTPAATLYANVTGNQPDLRTLDGYQDFQVWTEAAVDGFERAREWARSAPANVGLFGAATREASSALTQLSADTGLSIDQLREWGLVSSTWNDTEYLNISAAQRVLPDLIGQLSGGLTAATSLYTW
jgi:hypothetical protein